MSITTYTLWHGFRPLIVDHGTKYPHDERARYRVSPSTMTQGVSPYHAKTREEAERLAELHSQDGESLEIEAHEVIV
jgi:hypothetical protein